MKTEDYIKGWKDGYSADYKHPQTIYILGKSLDEVCKIIIDCEMKEKEMADNKIHRIDLIDDKVFEIYRKGKLVYSDKEKKMTREEAIEKLSKTHNKAEANFFLIALETLGLIKFDLPKPERKYIFFPHPDNDGKDNVSVYQDDAIETMKKYGYEIWDKDGNRL